MAKRWLVVFSSYKLTCFFNTHGVRWLIVMMLADELYLEDFRDIEDALVLQDPINVIPDFWVLYTGLSGLLVFDLQFV